MSVFKCFTGINVLQDMLGTVAKVGTNSSSTFSYGLLPMNPLVQFVHQVQKTKYKFSCDINERFKTYYSLEVNNGKELHNHGIFFEI